MAQVFEEAGRGRKECPGCHKFVSVANRVCPGCDYDFKADAEPQPEAPKAAQTWQSAPSDWWDTFVAWAPDAIMALLGADPERVTGWDASAPIDLAAQVFMSRMVLAGASVEERLAFHDRVKDACVNANEFEETLRAHNYARAGSPRQAKDAGATPKTHVPEPRSEADFWQTAMPGIPTPEEAGADL